MEVKHKECFIPNTIKQWGLQPVSRYAREAAEFVNLYSKWRGINRWPALLMVFDLLRERAEVQARGVTLPEVPCIREFIADDGYAKSNDGLRAYAAAYPAPGLDTAMAWTQGVNAAVAEMVHGVPPFPHARESLERIVATADVIVVSATPVGALTREWTEHDLARYVRVITGQEMGKKALHLELATGDKYAPDRVLMIGDAPGDMRAARANGALFYPINPGRKAESWARFYAEAFDRFTAGRYAGSYETELVAEFEGALPDVPPWRK